MTAKLRLRADLSRLSRRGNDAQSVTDTSYDLRTARETAKQWSVDPSVYQRIDLDILSALLLVVYELDQSEIDELRIKDLFNWINST